MVALLLPGYWILLFSFLPVLMEKLREGQKASVAIAGTRALTELMGWKGTSLLLVGCAELRSQEAKLFRQTLSGLG